MTARRERSKVPPAALLDAFRKTESPSDQAGAALLDDGIDTRMIRVLVAWLHTDNVWLEPARERPDGDRATAASWRWIVEGWTVDYDAISLGADVSVAVARAKMGVLIGCRLVYPDGKASSAARLLIQGALRRAVRAGREKKQPTGQATTAPSPPPRSGNKPGTTN